MSHSEPIILDSLIAVYKLHFRLQCNNLPWRIVLSEIPSVSLLEMFYVQ